MTDTTDQPHKRSLAELWQWPLLFVSVGLLLLGWYLALPDNQDELIAASLDNSQTLINAHQYGKALDMLAGIEEPVASGQVPQPVRGRWYLLRGDAVYLGMRTRGWSRGLGAETVVTSYNTAEQLGIDLDRRHLERLAESLMQMGELERVRGMLPRFGDESDPLRLSLQRRLIESAIHQHRGEPDAVQEQLDQYLAHPGLRRQDRIWAIARTVDLQIQQKAYRQALDKLLRYRARLELDGKSDLGELFVLQGQAYFELGDLANAEQSYLRASQVLHGDAEQMGVALVGLGRVRLAEGNVLAALEHFADAADGFATTKAHLPALIGKAECEARRGAIDQAVTDYTEAVDLVKRRGAAAGTDRAVLINSLHAEQRHRRTQQDYPALLQLLELEKQLYGTQFPPALLQAMAAAYEHQGHQLLGVAPGDVIDRIDRTVLTRAQRQKMGEAFATAAEYYSRHAQAVATSADSEAYRVSLWRAADCYDKAGMYREAITRFETFIEKLPDDPWSLRASFRLGQCCQADGQFDRAIEIYTDLNEQHPKASEAYSALVPLARCHIARGVEGFDHAEQVLRSVVTDHPALGPNSLEYREALVELGRLYYSRGEDGDYEKAIACLDEAVQRYADHPDRAALWFQLGDAYRKSVDQIRIQLTQPVSPAKKLDLQAARADRLDKAQACFDRVIRLYRSQSEMESLDALQELYLRNSYFYQADCAYDLGRYEGDRGAIALYQQAVAHYEKDPSVLVALIQIVNSYCEMGQYDKARAANEQAKWHLKRIPDQAFDDPNLPMTREHWKRWLDWRDQLDLRASAQDGP